MKLKRENRVPITKKQAERRTAQHRKEFATLKKGWVHLGAEVEKSVQLGVPAALGQNMREWLESTFPESASYIFRQLQSYRALKGVPQSTLEAIPEGSAHELTRLKEKDRKDPKMLRKAREQSPKEFKETVAEIRETEYHIPKETWKTFAIRVPLAVYDLLQTAQAKMGRVLQVDLEDDAVRIKSLITIWEVIAALVNDTPEEWLVIETTGGGPLEELAIRSKGTRSLSNSGAKSETTPTSAAS
jgi:hypothetical protein